MARKTRARRTVRGTSSVIEKSLRDAQKVLSGYMESGGRQVKDTIGSLVKIFENQHLTDALASGSRRISHAVTGGGTAKRRPGTSRGRRTAGRAGTAKVTPGKRAATKSRTAAARAASAKRTKATRRRKP